MAWLSSEMTSSYCHRRQHRGRPREVARRRFERRRLGHVVARQQLLGGQSLGEAGALGDALAPLRFRPLGVVEAQRLAGVGIDAAPPADEGRQVMRGDRRQRIARIGAGSLEPAAMLALEGEDAVAQDAGLHQRVGEALRRGAEILGDDEALGPVAFEPQHRQHRLERHGDIGPVLRRSGDRDEEEPGELERVVDADRTGMAHVRLDQGAERREPVALHFEGVERRQAPILALGREEIRRRTDGDTIGEALRMRPDFRPAAIGADGEVAVEAEAHAAFEGGLRCVGQLAVGEVLEPDMVGDGLGMGQRERLHGRSPGAAHLLRPIAGPIGAERLVMGGQGLERPVGFEIRPALLAEGREGGVLPRASRRFLPERLQHGGQHAPDAGMVHQGRGLKAGDVGGLVRQ